MKKGQEYKILPQIEEDNFYIDDRRRRGWIYCLVGATFVLLVTGLGCVVIILGGWTDDVYNVIGKYIDGPPNPNTTDYPPDFGQMTDNFTGEVKHLTAKLNGTGKHSMATSAEVSAAANTTSSMEVENGTVFSTESTDGVVEMAADGMLKFTEMMRTWEKEMERLSGIHQAELVIPLFMLIILMSALALLSLCCCIMSKQREKRQRKLLGKIITDLQTGDSKTVLLARDDGDM